MQVIQVLKSKKGMFGLGISLLLVVSLLGCFLIFYPQRNVKSFANEYVGEAISDKTYIQEENLFNPKVVVYTQGEDFSVTTHFLQLERDGLLGWKVKKESTLISKVEENLNDQAKSEQAKDNLESIENAIKEGSLTEGDTKGVQYTLSESSIPYSDRDITLESNNGGLKIIIHELVGGGTTVELNGKMVDGLSNVQSVTISTDNKYIYYTKYELRNSDETDFGSDSEDPLAEEYAGDYHSTEPTVVFRLNLETLNEEEVYTFDAHYYMSLGATSEYLVYVLDWGLVGKVNLTTKENTRLSTLDVFDGADPSPMIYLDDQVVKVMPANVQYLQTGASEIVEIEL